MRTEDDSSEAFAQSQFCAPGVPGGRLCMLGVPGFSKGTPADIASAGISVWAKRTEDPGRRPRVLVRLPRRLPVRRLLRLFPWLVPSRSGFVFSSGAMNTSGVSDGLRVRWLMSSVRPSVAEVTGRACLVLSAEPMLLPHSLTLLRNVGDCSLALLTDSVVLSLSVRVSSPCSRKTSFSRICWLRVAATSALSRFDTSRCSAVIVSSRTVMSTSASAMVPRCSSSICWKTPMALSRPSTRVMLSLSLACVMRSFFSATATRLSAVLATLA
mmetsp:Transcript_7068/g.20645  ORF Transcript_7068/g.20645 Transcript_7068/m.20645 type:complete len:270 (+) Transcript_7068:618-1427(+)